MGIGKVIQGYWDWRAGHPAGLYWLLFLIGGPAVVWGVSCLMAPKVIIEGGAFAYDTIEGILYRVPKGELPPMDTPAQREMKLRNGDLPAGVRANVFSCGRCNEKEWYIGYLETYEPAAKAAQIRMNEQEAQAMKRLTWNADGTMAATQGTQQADPELVKVIALGHLVARGNDPGRWYRQDSPQGVQTVEAAVKKCPDGKWPTQCFAR